MRKLSVILFLFCAANVFAAEDALNQAQSMTLENLANTKYYDQVHNSANSQDTSLTNKHGKFTTMRENAGYGFDTPADKKMSYQNGGSNRHVDAYVANTEDGRKVIMESPTVNIPPVSKPVSVDASETDDMFLDMLGDTSSENSYKGDYETAVGTKQEQNFDMSNQLTEAAEKQNRANVQFENDVALAKQKQAQQAALQAMQAQQQKNLNNNRNNGSNNGGSFWGNIGKAFAQGAVNAIAQKHGLDPIDFNNGNSGNSGNGNTTCRYGEYTFRGQACDLCVYNKPRSSYACDRCCRSLGRPLMQAPSYYATSSGGRPSGCLCRFGPTSGLRF